jgi:hypothetical protein
MSADAMKPLLLALLTLVASRAAGPADAKVK